MAEASAAHAPTPPAPAAHASFDGRREDEPLLRGHSTYIDGLHIPELDGAAHAVFVRSAEAHARLAEVDADEARHADGVLAVYVGREVDGWPFPPRLPSMNRDLWRPLMAWDTVRFVGEPIALVIAESRAAATDAAEFVIVDYDPLPAVVDLEASLSGEILLHEHAGTNVALAWELDPVPDDVWVGCDVTIEFDLLHPRLGPHPIEPLAGASAWGADGRCTAWVCSQRPAGAKHVIETLLGLEPGTVRAISPDVGGGFGAKGGWGCYPEDVAVAWAARELGRPIRWAQTRSEASLAMGHGRASRHRVRIGGNRDGKIVAYAVDALQDSGAYPAMGTNATNNLRNSGTGVYDIAHATLRGTSVVTNTTPTAAFRGAGRPEAACSVERAVDRFAAAIGRDPLGVRFANLVPADRFPYRTAVGATYDSGNYPHALAMAAELADYDGLRAEQAARRSGGSGGGGAASAERLLGIGVSCTTEVTGGGEGERATAMLLDDGTVDVVVGTSPHGQGHETTFAPVVAAQLGIDADRIVISHDDSDRSPVGGGTIGSRSAQLGGAAAHGVAVDLAAAARERAAELLEADPADVVLDRRRGLFHVVGTPARTLGWADLARHGELSVDHHFQPEGRAGSFSFGACVSAVEIDPATGEVEIRRLLSVDDAGVILQPVLADGQIHGGLALAVGAVLYEEMHYDEDANPMTVGLADYALPSAAELPYFETHETVTPSPLNPLGAKGIGESGTVVATPALQSAVLDALAPFGVEHLDLPFTPEKIWRALHAG